MAPEPRRWTAEEILDACRRRGGALALAGARVLEALMLRDQGER